MPRKKLNIKGLKFNRLIAIRDSGKNINGKTVWLCQCDCGNLKEVMITNLKNGNTKSCGCLLKENGRKWINEKIKKHGLYKTGVYNSWHNMKQRCLNINNPRYKIYKDKTICERWMKFENFLADMGERPEGYDIHRIDNDKGYYPDNCEWKEKSKHAREHKRRL